VRKVDGTDMLNLGAHAHTVAAENAFVFVTDNGKGRGVKIGRVNAVAESYALDTVSPGNVLQFAFAVFRAGGAVTAMVGEKKLEDHFPMFTKPRSVCKDLHAGFRRSGAGSMDASPFILYHTDTAGAVNGQLRMVAEGGEVNSGFADYLQDIGFPLKRDGHFVYKHKFTLHLH
jgi:hypothetical protein